MSFNMLSVLIYFAETLGSVSSLATFLFIASFFGIVVVSVMWCAIAFDRDRYDESPSYLSDKIENLIKKLTVCAAILAIVGTFVPSSRTVYLIAASEMGEEVINTDTAIKLKMIIDHKLDEIIAEEQITQKQGE